MGLENSILPPREIAGEMAGEIAGTRLAHFHAYMSARSKFEKKRSRETEEETSPLFNANDGVDLSVTNPAKRQHAEFDEERVSFEQRIIDSSSSSSPLESTRTTPLSLSLSNTAAYESAAAAITPLAHSSTPPASGESGQAGDRTECKGCNRLFPSAGRREHESGCTIQKVIAEEQALFGQQRFDRLAHASPAQRALWQHKILPIAKKASDEVMEDLIDNFKKVGYDQHDLCRVFRYIRTEAPLIAHFPLGRLNDIRDAGITNRFEQTASQSSAAGDYHVDDTYDWEKRVEIECRLFGYPRSPRDSFRESDRPRYGCLDLRKNPRGVWQATSYGHSRLELHDDLRLLTSLTYGDSFNGLTTLATLEHCAHVLTQLHPLGELLPLIQVALGEDMRWCSQLTSFEQSYSNQIFYIEAQIHAPIPFDTQHVKKLHLSRRPDSPALTIANANMIITAAESWCNEREIEVHIDSD